MEPTKDSKLVEIYSSERKAEFLFSNAVDVADYRVAVRLVKKMGLDPRKVDHFPPPGVMPRTRAGKRPNAT